MRYRENTLSSFRESVKTGVTFIEFDVQVTADGVPVLFHDDLIEWGDPSDHHSAPISELSLRDFKALCGHQVTTPVVRKTRGENLTWQEQRGAWTCAVEDEMPTLAELFAGLPENVGFDLEVKMTTPSTTTTSPAELDRMLGPIIDAVARNAGNRPLVYSSFDPDICVELAKRQAEHKVLFLTHCEETHCDARRRSVVAAIDLANTNSFAGIVVDTAHLHEFPSLIQVVKSQGLYLASYGLKNNEEEWVEAQVAAGVDAVIADDVTRVVTRLR
jgi:glycerophosphodiester phosphodiesterase